VVIVFVYFEIPEFENVSSNSFHFTFRIVLYTVGLFYEEIDLQFDRISIGLIDLIDLSRGQRIEVTQIFWFLADDCTREVLSMNGSRLATVVFSISLSFLYFRQSIIANSFS